MSGIEEFLAVYCQKIILLFVNTLFAQQLAIDCIMIARLK